MINDLLIVAAPTVAFLVGFAGGRLTARRARAPKPLKAICPCEHSVAYHKEGTGPCHGSESRSKYNSRGEWVGRDYVPCTCQVYAGPELMSSLTMRETTFREIASPESQNP